MRKTIRNFLPVVSVLSSVGILESLDLNVGVSETLPMHITAFACGYISSIIIGGEKSFWDIVLRKASKVLTFNYFDALIQSLENNSTQSVNASIKYLNSSSEVKTLNAKLVENITFIQQRNIK